jgi:hypothetical protein
VVSNIDLVKTAGFTTVQKDDDYNDDLPDSHSQPINNE